MLVANAQQEAAEDIGEVKQEQLEAAADLRTTQQQLQANQARDAYVKDVEQRLADTEKRIDELEEGSTNAQDAEKQAIDQQIEMLQAQRDRAEDALEELKSAELAHWQNHQQTVRVAMQELNASLNKIR